MFNNAIVLTVFFVFTSPFTNVHCETLSVPFTSDDWSFSGQEMELRTHLGRQALYVYRGDALLSSVDFDDGIIEFDVSVPADTSFSKVFWRAHDLKNREEFFLRSHLSGKPDATQYQPVFNDISSWQIYSGSKYTAAVQIPAHEWIHVRVEVLGESAAFYVNGDEPILIVDKLKRGTSSGFVGVSAVGSGVYYSDFRVNTDSTNISIPKGQQDVDHLPAGLVKTWQVSGPIDNLPASDCSGFCRLDTSKISWKRLEVEDNGIANLARIQSTEKGSTVLARVVVEAKEAQVRKVNFGFSDIVRVYANGRLLYEGKDTYRSRDYRFLGTVGIFDSLLIQLAPGRNEIVFAVTEDIGGWAIIADIEPLHSTID